MRVIRVALVCVLAFASTAGAQSNSLPDARHLLVKGHAERDVLPDRFTIRMTIEAVDTKPDLARSRVQAHVAALLEAMKRAHALEDRIAATSIEIKPKTDYRDGEEVFRGTRVSRTLRATFGSAEDLQAFLGSVDTNQEVQINGIDTVLESQEAVEEALRSEAIATTRRKADEMAKAYGAKVAGLYSASDVAPDFDYGLVAFPRTGGRKLERITVTGSRIAPEELEVGTVTLKADVYAVFLLAD